MKIIHLSILVILLGLTSQWKVDQLFLGEPYEAGLIDVTPRGDSLFYWMFKSRDGNKNAPLLMWLSGGPGSGSEIAVLYENGPFP